jgi:aminoglycoside phosphotransferase
LIPPPPPDPILPGMAIAWDGDAIGELLNRAFGDVSVQACEPYYVKYQPERYCRFQYRVELADKDRRILRVPASVSLYPPRRAEKLAARYGLLHEDGSHLPRHAAYVPELPGIVALFPVDFGLPGLAEATSAEAMSRRFQRLEDRVGDDLQGCEVELVRYKAEKRAVLRYRLHGTHVGTVYGKLRKDGGGSLCRVARALARAGVSTPEPIAYLADLEMFVQAEGSGARLADLRHAAEYEGWMPAVAEALVRLHEAEVEDLPRHSPSAEADELRAAARNVAALLPELGSFTRHLADRLAARLSTIDGGLAPTHGSFHDDQVLVDDTGVTLVDLDGALLANPLSDVGHLLSYLSAEGAGDAYERFLTCYRAARPGFADDHLVFESASLLRWATLPFRELRGDWPEAVEQRVRLAGTRLDET